MSMSDNTTNNPNTDHESASINAGSNELPEPVKKRSKWKPSLIWLIPMIALLIALSLALKAYLNTGPMIDVSFRTAEGLEAGKTTVRYKNVNIGLVQQIDLAEDRSHVIAKVELRKSASNFAAKDTRFWVVRPRIGTGGISGIDTLLSGAYIDVDGGKSQEKERVFKGLETPPVISSDVPGKIFFLNAKDLGSLDFGSPIYYRRMNVGQVTAYKIAPDGQSIELQTFIRAPFDKFVTKDARFWQASGLDVSLNASGFSLNTQSLASIVAGGIAFGYPEDSKASSAEDHSRFKLWDNRTEALKAPDVNPRRIVMYFSDSLRGLSVNAPIDFMGVEIGNVQAINTEFLQDYTQIRMRVDAIVYPSRIANGNELDPQGTIFKNFVERGWRAQIRTGNLLTGQNYIAFDAFPKVKYATLNIRPDGVVEVPTTPTDLKGLQTQITEITEKVNKFPIVEIGQDVRKTLNTLETTVQSTKKLVDQLDGKVAPNLQATLDDVRKTVRSSETILSSDAPMQQDLRRALQQVTRAAASLQLMADQIEQHPESLIRGKTSEPKKNDN